MLWNEHEFIRIQHRAGELLDAFLLDKRFAIGQFFVCRSSLKTQLPGSCDLLRPCIGFFFQSLIEQIRLLHDEFAVQQIQCL